MKNNILCLKTKDCC